MRFLSTIKSLTAHTTRLLSSASSVNMVNKKLSDNPLLLSWEDENVYPLVALGGVAWMSGGETVPAVTFILVNEDGRNAVVEQTESGYCLLSSGNVVEYNSDKIKEMMKWE